MSTQPSLPPSAAPSPNAITTLDPLLPLHHIILRHLYALSPALYLSLSKSTYRHAIRDLYDTVTFSSSNLDKLQYGRKHLNSRKRTALSYIRCAVFDKAWRGDAGVGIIPEIMEKFSLAFVDGKGCFPNLTHVRIGADFLTKGLTSGDTYCAQHIRPLYPLVLSVNMPLAPGDKVGARSSGGNTLEGALADVFYLFAVNDGVDELHLYITPTGQHPSPPPPARHVTLRVNSPWKRSFDYQAIVRILPALIFQSAAPDWPRIWEGLLAEDIPASLDEQVTLEPDLAERYTVTVEPGVDGWEPEKPGHVGEGEYLDEWAEGNKQPEPSWATRAAVGADYYGDYDSDSDDSSYNDMWGAMEDVGMSEDEDEDLEEEEEEEEPLFYFNPPYQMQEDGGDEDWPDEEEGMDYEIYGDPNEWVPPGEEDEEGADEPLPELEDGADEPSPEYYEPDEPTPEPEYKDEPSPEYDDGPDDEPTPGPEYEDEPSPEYDYGQDEPTPEPEDQDEPTPEYDEGPDEPTPEPEAQDEPTSEPEYDDGPSSEPEEREPSPDYGEGPDSPSDYEEDQGMENDGYDEPMDDDGGYSDDGGDGGMDDYDDDDGYYDDDYGDDDY
ncbi:hypothetical protein IAT38_002317 [Cryptococcus sp. DSM 104549]